MLALNNMFRYDWPDLHADYGSLNLKDMQKYSVVIESFQECSVVLEWRHRLSKQSWGWWFEAPIMTSL